VLDISVSGQATASTTQGSPSTLAPALAGKTVCVGASPTFTSQEYHSGTTGGSIIDYKRGSSDPKDPTTTIGSWSVSGNQVTYTYTSGGSYSYTVWQQSGGTTFDFCNGTTAIVSAASIKAGQTGC
jgi:hypothetical protein